MAELLSRRRRLASELELRLPGAATARHVFTRTVPGPRLQVDGGPLPSWHKAMKLARRSAGVRNYRILDLGRVVAFDAIDAGAPPWRRWPCWGTRPDRCWSATPSPRPSASEPGWASGRATGRPSGPVTPRPPASRLPSTRLHSGYISPLTEARRLSPGRLTRCGTIAGGGTRTLMRFRAADFKSAVSSQFHHPGTAPPRAPRVRARRERAYAAAHRTPRACADAAASDTPHAPRRRNSERPGPSWSRAPRARGEVGPRASVPGSPLRRR